jgi:hypothetical protein
MIKSCIIGEMQRPASNTRAAFFSQKNRATLEQIVVNDFQRRQGQQLNSRQMDRLERALDHYIEQVYETQGDQPLPVLNREVIKITAQDFSKYLQRQNVIQTQTQTPTQAVMSQSQSQVAGLFQDTSTRYEMIQNERQETQDIPPPAPDFRIALDDSGPSSVDLFEQAKKARESEALRLLNASKDAMERMDPGLNARIAADDMFRSSQQQQNKATDLAVIERRATVKPLNMPLIVPPDGRELLLANNPGPRVLGDANASSVTTVPSLMTPFKTNLPQDYLIRQEDVVTYKEVENNLFVYSADRDWLKNTTENRYSFSVLFDPANNGQGLYPQVSVQQKFKNIVRIELVKAILPIEGLTTLIQKTSDTSNNTDYQLNVLSFPYISVRIPELENNNYGSDNFLDRAFGVLQYDANWYSDPGTTPGQTDSRGFTALIPKFLKCQKIYSPAPLSTLQRLTIDMLLPNGNPISSAADTFDITTVLDGHNTSGSIYSHYSSANASEYFFIETTNYFSRFQIAVGDTIRIANFDWNSANTNPASSTMQAFLSWLNQSEGHTVVQTAYGSYTSPPFTPNIGTNTVGYANWIIIQNKYNDPTTGSVTPYQFGGANGDISTELATATPSTWTVPRRLMNLNRQTHMVFRVITREMDSVAQLRPDNM